MHVIVIQQQHYVDCYLPWLLNLSPLSGGLSWRKVLEAWSANLQGSPAYNLCPPWTSSWPHDLWTQCHLQTLTKLSEMISLWPLDATSCRCQPLDKITFSNYITVWLSNRYWPLTTIWHYLYPGQVCDLMAIELTEELKPPPWSSWARMMSCQSDVFTSLCGYQWMTVCVISCIKIWPLT